MGVFYESIPPTLKEWILSQKVFWVASAPLSGSGNVNVSPKGGPYFGLIDEKTFWYLDLTGSGNETISHLHEHGNGRITVMFNAFVGAPKIVRLWGKGRVLECGTSGFDKFVAAHKVELIAGTRSIIVVDIHQVGSSCGYSVPFFDFKEYRPTLNEHWQKKEQKYKAGNEKESMPRYWAFKNARSMDGLPGMKIGLETGRRERIAPMKKMVGPLAPSKYKNDTGFGIVHLVLVALVSFLLGAIMMKNGLVLRGGINGRWPMTTHSLISRYY